MKHNNEVNDQSKVISQEEADIDTAKGRARQEEGHFAGYHNKQMSEPASVGLPPMTPNRRNKSRTNEESVLKFQQDNQIADEYPKLTSRFETDGGDPSGINHNGFKSYSPPLNSPDFAEQSVDYMRFIKTPKLSNQNGSTSVSQQSSHTAVTNVKSFYDMREEVSFFRASFFMNCR